MAALPSARLAEPPAAAVDPVRAQMAVSVLAEAALSADVHRRAIVARANAPKKRFGELEVIAVERLVDALEATS